MLCKANPICLRLFWHLMRLAASRAFCTAGSKRPTSTAMMAMATSNSIRVNARRRRVTMDCLPLKRVKRLLWNHQGQRSSCQSELGLSVRLTPPECRLHAGFQECSSRTQSPDFRIGCVMVIVKEYWHSPSANVPLGPGCGGQPSGLWAEGLWSCRLLTRSFELFCQEK